MKPLNKQQEAIFNALAFLTEKERLEIFEKFCPNCGRILEGKGHCLEGKIWMCGTITEPKT